MLAEVNEALGESHQNGDPRILRPAKRAGLRIRAIAHN
jgi:hypothetical protein